jgi:hypothetical protein
MTSARFALRSHSSTAGWRRTPAPDRLRARPDTCWPTLSLQADGSAGRDWFSSRGRWWRAASDGRVCAFPHRAGSRRGRRARSLRRQGRRRRRCGITGCSYGRRGIQLGRRLERDGRLIGLHLRYGAARTERDKDDGRGKAQYQHYASPRLTTNHANRASRRGQGKARKKSVLLLILVTFRRRCALDSTAQFSLH